VQNLLTIRRETRIFTKRRSKLKNNFSNIILLSIILGKVLLQIGVALFICFICIIYSINPSEARTLKSLTIFSRKEILAQHYSGLIVYIKKDKDFKRSMSPRIISEKGRSIYLNTNNLSSSQYKFLINNGIATFTDKLSIAKKRAGNNPYIVNAIGSVNSDTAVISEQNALKILKENQKSNFLNNFKVSFVIN
jgi:hypothetical protein